MNTDCGSTSTMIYKVVLMLLIALMISGNLLAYDEGTGDEAPESDVSKSIESDPMKGLDIQTVTFEPVKGKPVIDGKVDDEFWSQAEYFDLQYELYPTRLAPAAVKTEGMIATTSDYVYVAFIAHDPDIKNLRSAAREHDGTKEDDYVSIILDPSGQGAKKYEFRVNPHGSLSDVLQDTISDRWIYDWDTEWTGEAQITETGYTVELKIPLDSIRQPEIEIGEKNLGIMILKRSYPRRIDRVQGTFFMVNRSRYQILPADTQVTPPQKNEVTADKPRVDTSDKTSSQMQNGNKQAEEILDEADEVVVELAGKKDERKNFQITPYYIYHLDEERDIGGTFEQVDEHKEHEIGFDAKYQIDSARSIAVTYNPNFTEVEADIARQSINNPFTAFKPEKRSFFRDANEYYNTLLPIVYTRNIISPEFGASYLRTGTNNSIGVFFIRDEETEVIMPDTFGSDKVTLDEENTSAAFRYQYSKNKKTIGLLATYRSGEDGYHNSVGGVDGLINLGIDDKVRYQIMYSDTVYPQSFAEDLCETDGCTQPPPPPVPCPLGNCDTNAQVLRTNFGETLTGHGLRLSYRHDGPKSLGWVNYFDVAPDFRADLGFARKVDIRVVNAAYGRKLYVNALDADAGKSRIRFYAIGNHHRSHEGNNELETGFTGLGEFRGSHQTVLRFAWRKRDIAVNRIDQSSLATGDNAPLFPENYWFWYYQIAPNVKWRFDLNGRIGKIADADNMALGDMTELKPKILYRLGNFEVAAEGVFRDFQVDNERLYKETFLTYSLLYRKNRNISHRLLILDDLTLQNVNHPKWLDKSEDERESEESVEYTFTYKKDKSWKVLFGFKLLYEQENDSVEDLTDQEIYFKLERQYGADI